MIELSGDRAIRAADIKKEIERLNSDIECRVEELSDLYDKIDDLESVQKRDEKRIEALEAELETLAAEEADPELAERNAAIKAWWQGMRNPKQIKLPFAGGAVT